MVIKYLSSSDSCPLLTLICQGQLQIQRMSSCPASAAWHSCRGLSLSQDSAQLQPRTLPLQNLPSPSERHVAGQALAREAPRQLCFLPYSISLCLLECVCTWWKKCREQGEASRNVTLPVPVPVGAGLWGQQARQLTPASIPRERRRSP